MIQIVSAVLIISFAVFLIICIAGIAILNDDVVKLSMLIFRKEAPNEKARSNQERKEDLKENG